MGLRGKQGDIGQFGPNGPKGEQGAPGIEGSTVCDTFINRLLDNLLNVYAMKADLDYFVTM